MPELQDKHTAADYYFDSYSHFGKMLCKLLAYVSAGCRRYLVSDLL